MLAKSSFDFGQSVDLPHPRFCALIPEGRAWGRVEAVWHGHSWLRENTHPPHSGDPSASASPVGGAKVRRHWRTVAEYWDWKELKPPSDSWIPFPSGPSASACSPPGSGASLSLGEVHSFHPECPFSAEVKSLFQYPLSPHPTDHNPIV